MLIYLYEYINIHEDIRMCILMCVYTHIGLARKFVRLFATSYRRTQTNFLANPPNMHVYIHIYDAFVHILSQWQWPSFPNASWDRDKIPLPIQQNCQTAFQVPSLSEGARDELLVGISQCSVDSFFLYQICGVFMGKPAAEDTAILCFHSPRTDGPQRKFIQTNQLKQFALLLKAELLKFFCCSLNWFRENPHLALFFPR